MQDGNTSADFTDYANSVASQRGTNALAKKRLVLHSRICVICEICGRISFLAAAPAQEIAAGEPAG